MPRPHITDRTGDLRAGFEQIRRELDVREEFPPEVIDATARAVDRCASERSDRRDIPFVSIDPKGSRDLDQAFHLSRRKGGFRFHYAIADVAAWVVAGDPIDIESRERGSTVYCPDTRVPLHPLPLSEGAASLLPDEDRPAVLWTIDLDDGGEVADVAVERALIRNRAALNYVDAQRHIDDGGNDEQLRLLEEVGTLRIAREVDRCGVSLSLPEQIVVHAAGGFRLTYESTRDTERWNAQLSLCCGMAAAALMLDNGVGILRTLPAPDPDVLDGLRIASRHLGVPWPADLTYPDWVRRLDTSTDRGMALTVAASRTLRGAAYAAFDGSPPPDVRHHAIAAPYAHVTAPLRRLVDRFGTECALAAHRNRRPPAWVLDALEGLDPIMARTAARVSAVERACVDLVEAAVLSTRLYERLAGVVTALREDASAVVQIEDPAVIANAPAARGVEAGDRVTVRVVEADPSTRTVRFEIEPS